MNDKSREALQEEAFSDLPEKIADISLRPLSSRSWTLLSRLGNPLLIGVNKESKENGTSQMIEGVIQYAYVHSVAIEKVITITAEKDLDADEMARLGFAIPVGQALAFMDRFTESAQRFAASKAEAEEADEDDDEGKSRASLPAGSPLSASPSGRPETQLGSDTSSGISPLPAPLPISTPPTSPMELPAGGLLLMPPVREMTPDDPSSKSSPISEPAGEPITPAE